MKTQSLCVNGRHLNRLSLVKSGVGMVLSFQASRNHYIVQISLHKGGLSMLQIHNCGVNEPSPRKRKRPVGLEISLQWLTTSQQSTQKDGFGVAFMERIIESYCYGKLPLVNARGARPPPYFWTKLSPEGPKKMFWETPLPFRYTAALLSGRIRKACVKG